MVIVFIASLTARVIGTDAPSVVIGTIARAVKGREGQRGQETGDKKQKTGNGCSPKPDGESASRRGYALMPLNFEL